MAFCTSCGKELTPGVKFCESCGAPVEQPAVPAQPSPVSESAAPTAASRPPLVPPPPSEKPVPAMLIAIIVIALVIIAAGAWFIGLPYLQIVQAGSQATPVPTTPPVTYTPKPTTPAVTTTMPVSTTVTVRKLEGRFEEYYDEIYTLDKFFAFGQTETFAYDLQNPPLYIKYNLTPKLVTREKVINIGLSTEQTILITNPSTAAWFEVKVVNADNGAVVEKTGYAKDYPDATKSEFMVRSPGNYRIEFSGNDVMAEISVLKGTS